MALTLHGTNGITFNDSSTQASGKQVLKAYVRFNSAVSISASYNVSSVTDNGVGLWTVNYTTAFPDANYVALAWGGHVTTVQALIYYGVTHSAGSYFFGAVGLATQASVDPNTPDAIYFAAFA